MRATSEPTVEEILDSIKQVIARDNREIAAQQRQRRQTEGVVESAGRDSIDVLDLADSAEFVPDDDISDSEDESLINQDAQISMRESFAALAMLAEPGAQPQIVRSGETSIEGLVREMLRPALAEWLDKNLPPLVERMVAAEIRRIAGKKS